MYKNKQNESPIKSGQIGAEIMAETINYTVQEFSNDIKNIFKGVYNDFKNKAFDEYKFELTPLDFEDFVDSVNANLIKCLVT